MSHRVHVLLSKPLSKNEYAFAAPVQASRFMIRDLGMEVHFFNVDSDKALDCDALIVSSDFVAKKNLWPNVEKVNQWLQKARATAKRLIWADMGDSTGTGHFSVLDYVDRYLKGSLLRDRNLYGNTHYAGRIFSDYYHKQYGIEDFNSGEAHLKITLSKPEHLNKLKLSWNQFFMSYSYFGFFRDALYRKSGWIPKKMWIPFKSPQKRKSLLLQARFSSNYKRATIAYQRQELTRLLGDHVPTDRVSRRDFYRELSDARYIISPFGWGEICYRDFEAIAAGAVLIKPNCDHMETWPNFYQTGKTYLDLDWDLTNLPDLLLEINKPESWSEHTEIARNAQERYIWQLGPEGLGEFAKRFVATVTFPEND